MADSDMNASCEDKNDMSTSNSEEAREENSESIKEETLSDVSNDEERSNAGQGFNRRRSKRIGPPPISLVEVVENSIKYRKTKGREKSFKCELCDHISNTKRKLSYHVATKHKTKPYVCDLCGYSSINQRILDRHTTALHSSVKPFVCPICGYQSVEKGRLNMHTAIKHEGVKPYGCQLCDFTTAYKVSLKLHMKGKHQDDRPFKCEICPYSAKNKNHLVSHVAAKHSFVKPYTCPQCDYSAAQKIHLDSHMASKHEGIKRFRCEICNYSTTKKHNLDRHLVTKHSDDAHRCQLCKFSCNSEAALDKHTLAHSRAKKKYYRKRALPKKIILYCHICDYTTFDKQNLCNHIYSHTAKEDYISSARYQEPPVVEAEPSPWENVDPEIFSPVTSLDVNDSTKTFDISSARSQFSSLPVAPSQVLPGHSVFSPTNKIAGVTEALSKDDPVGAGAMSMWTDLVSPTVGFLDAPTSAVIHTCRFCSFSSVSKNDLVTHLVSHQDEMGLPMDGNPCFNGKGSRVEEKGVGKQFVCSHLQCGYQTTHKDRLEAHEAIKHQGLKPYVCRICNFTTAYKVSLTLHIQGKHQDVRPFQCQLCPYSAKTKNHLMNHVAAKHSPTKPYACPNCDYAAAQKIHLDAHMASKHDGEKRFVCQDCDYSTAKKTCLVQHVNARHNKNPLRCHLCRYRCSSDVKLAIHLKTHDDYDKLLLREQPPQSNPSESRPPQPNPNPVSVT